MSKHEQEICLLNYMQAVSIHSMLAKQLVFLQISIFELIQLSYLEISCRLILLGYSNSLLIKFLSTYSILTYSFNRQTIHNEL